VRCLLTPSAAALVSPLAARGLSRHAWLPRPDREHGPPGPCTSSRAEWPSWCSAPTQCQQPGPLGAGAGRTLLAATFAPCESAGRWRTLRWNTAIVARGPCEAQLEQLQRFEVLPWSRSRMRACGTHRAHAAWAEPALLLWAGTLKLWGLAGDWLVNELLVTAGPTQECSRFRPAVSTPQVTSEGHAAQAARLRCPGRTDHGARFAWIRPLER